MLACDRIRVTPSSVQGGSDLFHGLPGLDGFTEQQATVTTPREVINDLLRGNSPGRVGLVDCSWWDALRLDRTGLSQA